MNIKIVLFVSLLATNIIWATQAMNKIILLHHLNAQVAAGVLNGISDSVSVSAQPETNSLLITGSAEDCIKMKQVIAILDIPLSTEVSGFEVFVHDENDLYIKLPQYL